MSPLESHVVDPDLAQILPHHRLLGHEDHPGVVAPLGSVGDEGAPVPHPLPVPAVAAEGQLDVDTIQPGIAGVAPDRRDLGLHSGTDVIGGEEADVDTFVLEDLEGIETRGAGSVLGVGRDQDVFPVHFHRVAHVLGGVPMDEVGTGGDSGSPDVPFPVLEVKPGIVGEEGRLEPDVGDVAISRSPSQNTAWWVSLFR